MITGLHDAIRILNQGGILIFPTDTAYGIGCRMDDTLAVKRLFDIRRRSYEKAVPVLVESIEMAQKYLTPIEDNVKDELLKRFWPGALTVVLPCQKNRVGELVRGGGGTLGVRMPNHVVPQTLIRGIQVPLLAPSANFAGEKTPYTIADIDKTLLQLVDFVIESDTTSNTVSTVVDCSEKPWKIVRQGAVQLVV